MLLRSKRSGGGWRKHALPLRQPVVHQSQFRYDLIPPIIGTHTKHFLAMKVPLLEQAIDTGLTRSARKRQEPARFRDFVPTSTVPSQMRNQYLTKKQRSEARARAAEFEQDPELPPADDGLCEDDGTAPGVHQQITTDLDPFGIFRKYSSIPSHNPDDFDPFDDTIPCQTSSTRRVGSNLHVSSAGHKPNPLTESENPTMDLLLGWWSEGACDGVESLNWLVECLRSQYFDISQLKDFNAVSAIRQFEKCHGFSKSKAALVPGDSWRTGSVKIRLPCAKVKQREEDAPEFTVNGLLYRDPVKVITKELQDPDSFEHIHLRPFEEWWKPSESDDPIRVYSDVYTSDAMLEAD